MDEHVADPKAKKAQKKADKRAGKIARYVSRQLEKGYTTVPAQPGGVLSLLRFADRALEPETHKVNGPVAHVLLHKLGEQGIGAAVILTGDYDDDYVHVHAINNSPVTGGLKQTYPYRAEGYVSREVRIERIKSEAESRIQSEL